MAVFELVIALLFGGAVLTAWARRLNAPYPALLALAGAALALLPGAPSLALDPELALTLFVAPVLLDAAFDASPRDLKESWRAVTSLAILAVGVTVAAVAFVFRWLVPDAPWPVAIALGAIVAPPDAAAATAVLRALRPPHRILVILEGESLFNDASSLLCYRLAVAAAMTGTWGGWKAAPMLVLVCAGSVALGLAVAWIMPRIFDRITDLSTSVIFQFITTFVVWMAAERLHLSGIIAVVVFAIRIARTAPLRMPARLRIPSYAVWEVAVSVLNVLAFIMVGLQLKPIIARLDDGLLRSSLVTAAAVCGAAILARFVWVMAYGAIGGQVGHRIRKFNSRRLPTAKGAAVIAWCGMRGIVTIAAALALPEAFPYRDLVVLCSFSVVLVTLVLQGMTLSPLMRLLRLEDDGTVDREVRLARAETARAAVAAVDGASDDPDLGLLRKKYQERLDRSERPGDDGETALEAAHRRVAVAERDKLSELRDSGAIGDDAFQRVEEELDWVELGAESLARR